MLEVYAVGNGNGPFAADGHMVQNLPYWRASYALGQHPKRFSESQCATRLPARWILYHSDR